MRERMRMRMRESDHYYCDSSQDEDAVLIHQSTKYGQVGRRPEKNVEMTCIEMTCKWSDDPWQMY